MISDPPYVASSLATRSLFAVYGNGWRVDWPIRYWDGRIGYEWPERVPKAGKRLVERAFKA